MNGGELPVKTEGMAAPQGVWTTAASQGMRPRPATIHEGFSYCMGEGYEGLPSWDPSGMPVQQTPSDTMTRPISVHQEFYPTTTSMESELAARLLGGWEAPDTNTTWQAIGCRSLATITWNFIWTTR